MSHEITVRQDGFAEAAFSLQPAWHGLGTVLDHVMTSKEAFEAAGLDWTVEQRNIYQRRMAVEGKKFSRIGGYKLNVRSDTELVLGLVSDDYKVVQNVEAFEFLDALVDNHEMLYESAFSLYGGRRVVVVARMPGYTEAVKGDPLLPYVVLSLSHDGKSAIKFGATAVRVVCANTLMLAERGGTLKAMESLDKDTMSVRHSGDIKAKLAKARNILGVASRQFAQYTELSQELAKRRLSSQEWREFLDIMCPELDPRDPDYTERRANALADTRLSIMAAFTNERQQTAPRTAWAAYNAVSEHIDHLPRRGGSMERKAEARFNVTLYGCGRDMKERAFQTACRFAGIGQDQAG